MDIGNIVDTDNIVRRKSHYTLFNSNTKRTHKMFELFKIHINQNLHMKKTKEVTQKEQY